MNDEPDPIETDLDPTLAAYFGGLREEALAGPPVEPSAAVREFVTGPVTADGDEIESDPVVTVVEPFEVADGARRKWPVLLAAAAISALVVGVAVTAGSDDPVDVAVATVADADADGVAEADQAPSTSSVPTTEAPPSTSTGAEAPTSTSTVAEAGSPELVPWPFGEWPELDQAIVVCDEELTVIDDADTSGQTPTLPPFEELREALERCHEELRNALGEDFPALELPPFDLDDLDIPNLMLPELLPPELFDGEGFSFEFPEGEGFLFTPEGDGFHFELEPIDPEELERWFDEIEPRLDDWLTELEPEIDRWFEEFEPELEPEIDRWFEELEPEIDRWLKELEPEIDEWFGELDPELREWLDEFDRDFEKWYEKWPAKTEEPASA